ncbi:cyclophilin-like fold protein [candidate division KSB1 bacterium]
MRKITIKAGSVSAAAVLNDSPTADLIWEALPIESRVSTWGDEIYFSIPVRADLEPDSREVLEVGELGYWPTGNAFCIFFGPTPASRGDEIRAASAVNIIGRVESDPLMFKTVESGAALTLEVFPEP